MADLSTAPQRRPSPKKLPVLFCLAQAARQLCEKPGDLFGVCGGAFLLYVLGFEICAVGDHGILFAAGLAAMGMASWTLLSAALPWYLGYSARPKSLPVAIVALWLPRPIAQTFINLLLAVFIFLITVLIFSVSMIFIVMVSNRYGLIFPEISLIGLLGFFIAFYIFIRLVLSFPAAFENPIGAVPAAWCLSRGTVLRLASGLALGLLPGLAILLAVLLLFGDPRQTEFPGFPVYYFVMDLPLPGGWLTLQALIVAASLVAALNGAFLIGFLAKAYEHLRQTLPNSG